MPLSLQLVPVKPAGRSRGKNTEQQQELQGLTAQQRYNEPNETALKSINHDLENLVSFTLCTSALGRIKQLNLSNNLRSILLFMMC